VFELAFAFESRIELLARVPVAAPMRLQEVTAAVGQDDGNVAAAAEPDGADEPLLAR
jgi:hypothetical protein